MGMSLALISSMQWKKRSSKRIRRRGKRKGEGFEIPLDLQIEILNRLPAKSLMRFKCVSKLWSSLIRSRDFTNRYLTVARPPRLYISLVDQGHECGSMEVCPNPEESLLLSLSSSSSSSSFAQDLMTMPGLGGHMMVVLRGLILYYLCRKACIFNPSTAQIVTLPAIESKVVVAREEETCKYVFYFLGHDPVLDQYKVVYIGVAWSEDGEWIESEHWVYVLEAGGSWKRIEFDQSHCPTRQGLCINGVLYYLGSAYQLSSDYLTRDIVFSFDVRYEKFDTIQVPQEVSEFGESIGFIEYAGKPTIFDHTHLEETGLVDLWVLEYGGKWSRKSLVLRPCQMHLVDKELQVEGTTQHGEVILVPKQFLSTHYVLYYDLQRNDLRKINIGGTWDHKLSKQKYRYLKLMDTGESILHLET